MEFVMVPVPEDHVIDVMQFVARLVARASILPWDEDAMSKLFGEADEAGRSLLSLVARRKVANKDLIEQDAADLLELNIREVRDIMRDVNDAARLADRDAPIVPRDGSMPLPNGRSIEVRRYEMDEAVAQFVRTAEQAERDAASAPVEADAAEAGGPMLSTAGNADYSDVVSVFEPASTTMPDLRSYVAECWQRRRFSIELARAQLKGQRSSTAAGELWALIDPAFQAAIYVFLFTVIRGGTGSATSYMTVIIFGVFMFSYTRAGIADAGRSIRRHQGLVLNSVFPRALLPLCEVYKGFLELLPALGIYGLVHLALRAPLGAGIFMLPLLIAAQTVMNVGLGLLFATLTVLIRDMSNIINYIVRALTFLTPVVYPISALSPGLRQILSFNPLYPLFACYQAIVIGATPTGGMVFASIAWALVFLALGTWTFLRHERSFALYL